MAKSSTQPTAWVPLWKFVVILLVALTTIPEVATAVDPPKNYCDGTQLVVLAGPRRSATTSVAEFFHKYARGAMPDRSHGKLYHPLAKIRWPLVYGSATNETEVDMPYKRFNLLVTSDNKAVKTEILDAIKLDYDQSGVSAVIFGGEEYDQVGRSASRYDAIQAVKAAVEITKAPPECVTIVLNYRVPRFEHFVSLYDALMSNGMPYEEHMCEDNSMTTRLDEIGTSMSPMYLAETYLEEGWNVRMIDMGGVEESGSDISHTIACEVLPGVCDDDNKWVKGHIEEVITNKAMERDFKSLPKKEIDLAEKLFGYRDCAYQEDLESNNRFSVIQQNTVWDTCQHDDEHDGVYQSFRDPVTGTRLVFDALLSQIDCQKYGGHPAFGDRTHSQELEAAKIEDFLNGNYQSSHSLPGEIEEEVRSLPIPLILVVLMFAGGASFYLMKMKEDPNYTIPGIEMGGFSDSLGGSKKEDGFQDEGGADESSSGESESDDEDLTKEVTADFI